jgi:hypothetical protein
MWQAPIEEHPSFQEKHRTQKCQIQHKYVLRN